MTPPESTTGHESLERVYAQHGPELLRYLRRLTGSVSDGSDLLQETFLRLWRQRDDEPITNVRAWLFRVATNLAQNHRRDTERQRTREREASTLRPTWISLEHALDAKTRVDAALSTIDERGRRVLLLFAEGFTYREISSITGIDAGYVGVLMQRARQQFRACLVVDTNAQPDIERIS